MRSRHALLQVLATGSADKMIRLWDLRAKKSLKIDTPDEASRLPPRAGLPPLCAVLSPLPRLRGRVRCCGHMRDGMCSCARTAQVLNVAYSANGDYIAMSDKSENVRLVDVRNGKNKAYPRPRACTSAAHAVCRNGVWWLRDSTGIETQQPNQHCERRLPRTSRLHMPLCVVICRTPPAPPACLVCPKDRGCVGNSTARMCVYMYVYICICTRACICRFRCGVEGMCGWLHAQGTKDAVCILCVLCG